MKRSESTTDPVDADGDAWRVILYWDKSSGRAECTGLSIWECRDTPGKPVTTTVVRSLNLGSLIEEQRREWADALEQIAMKENARWRAEAEALATPPQPRGGRAPLPLDELEEVALAWRLARTRGTSTTKAVAEKFHISESGAAKRIRRARDRGLLPPVNREGKK